MSATSSSSASTSYNVNIEAQNTLSGPDTTSPMPVLTHEIRTPARITAPIDPMDDFFGYTLTSTRTHDSRHDESNMEGLPPYVEEESNLPEYTPYAEPVTLAMYLFKFGFCKFHLFPNPQQDPHLFPLFVSVPSFLDIRSIHPLLAIARATCHI